MKPAFVLGIDGLPFTLSQKLINDGVFSNLGHLLQQGSLSQMHTTVPDFSCVAWTSFATGVNPGKHGIYGFQDFHPADASMYLPTNENVKVPALWHEVGNAGGRSVVMNLPGTYPATPLRGKMVSGFISPDFDRSYYPPAFGQTLKALGYRTDFDGASGLGFPDHVQQNLWPVFEARKVAIRHLIDNEYWDLAIAVITETDRLQHYFLHTLNDPNHELYEWTLRFYRELDGFIGEVAEKLEGNADLFMVSDHGFNVIRHEFVLHPLLQELGLMPDKINREPWMDPDVAKQCKVFAIDPGRFYINRKNSRFPHGCVEESEVPEIINRLTETLWNLTDPKTGEYVVNVVATGEEGFHGDEVSYAPDLVAGVKPGYYFKAHREPDTENFKDSVWEANHVWSDAIVYTPFPVKSNYQPMIWDVLPTVLTHMEIALPEYLDGQDLRR